ncbi:MAG TPA: hypothetical protein ENK91_16315 [Bacteroidetes bacterium]|nr:hypothetical protein [Bacteroidota bacterium]
MNVFKILFLALFPVLLLGQSREELENERLDIIQRIEFTSKILKQTEKNKTGALDILNSLENQISNRKKVLKNITKQIEQINKRSEENNVLLDSLKNQITEIREKYNQLLRINYIQSLTKNKFLFLISSRDWEDFIDKKRYLRQFGEFTKEKLKDLENKEAYLNKLISDIDKEKKDLEALKTDEKLNLELLEKEKKEKKKIFKKIRKAERKLRDKLKKQKREREKLNRNIEEAIVMSLRGVKNNDGEKATGTNKNFESNKNKLNWPVPRGYIYSHFGKHKHPVIKGVYIFNNGIDIRTESGASVQALFDGEIVGLMHISGYNWMMIIKHGDYYTVYSKLEKVTVSKGDKVTKGQTLGNIGENGQFHFEIWHKKTKLDPENWLR